MATAPDRADVDSARRPRDRSAWHALYTEFGPRLRPFAYRLTGNVHDADDLVQETFVRALPRLDRLGAETVEIGPYLFTTLRNLFLTSVDRGRRAEPVADVPEPSTPAPIENDPERCALLRRQQEDVRLATVRLAPRQRLVLALRELEDCSYAEIGAIVGLNENAVAQLISRARERLRGELRLVAVDPARLPEGCRSFLPLLSRHLDGQLRGAKLESTLAHLEGCRRCQDALASMREAQRRYRVLLPLFGAGEAQRERIDAELASVGYRSRPRRRPRGRAIAGAAAASLAVLAAGGGVGAAVPATDDEHPLVLKAAPRPVPVVATRPVRASGPARAVRAPRPAPAGPRAAATSRAAATQRTTTATAAPTTHRSTTVHVETAPAPKVRTPPHTPARPSATTEAEVDLTAPTVVVLSHPAAETTGTDAAFTFRASEPAATFACRLDGEPFAACSSPAVRHAVAPGAHAFAVRARDAAGNTGPVATISWTVLPPTDTTPPTATIVSAVTSWGDATFELASSEAGAVLACSLDGGVFESCTSPRAYTSLPVGPHTFAVQATDAAGNTGAPASHAWTVPPPPQPDLVISALTGTSFTVTNVGSAAAGPFVVSVTLVGTFSFAGLEPGRSETRPWAACRVGTITAIADRGRAVAESDEGNNARSLVSHC